MMTKTGLTWVSVALCLTLLVALGPTAAARAEGQPAAQICSAANLSLNSELQLPDEHPFLFKTQYLCCLDEWQPGSCPAGTRLASYCSSTCGNCGPTFCSPIPPKGPICRE